MKWRILLVGLIACLGLDFPAAASVVAWVSSASAPRDARPAERDAQMPDDATAFAPPVADDQAFTAAMDETLSTFADDQSEARTALAEPPTVDDDLDPGLAEAPAPQAETNPPTRLAAEPEPRGRRLAVAVRLTSEAVHAWADLLQAP